MCQLFSGGVTPSDIAQGQLGAPASLSAAPRLKFPTQVPR